MYLNYLEENEKVAFLKLAHEIARSDGELCDNEKIIIGSYCNEMGISDIELDKNESIEEISNNFRSDISKKIVILELMSIISANREFKKEEKEIIGILTNQFNIDDKYLENVKNWSELMLSLIEQGTSLIHS